MRRVPTDYTAADRARWLAEVAEALEQAQRLAWQLGSGQKDNAQALDLYFCIEAARLEVQSLRVSRIGQARAEHDPDWSGSPLWSRDPSDGMG